MFQPLIISAPFGNYHKLLNFEGVTHTLGTYTWEPRSWFTPPYGDRWTRALLTIRYSLVHNSWRNRLGLKNPGLRSYVRRTGPESLMNSDKIISIYGWNLNEWKHLFELIQIIQPFAVEINASCPNVDKPSFTAEIFNLAMRTGVPVIVKIPPVFYQKIVEMAYGEGVRYFHACNTLPSPKGGISGKPLLLISQGVVRWLRETYPSVGIIGGGGVTSAADARAYRLSGADHVAIGSMLMFPWNWSKVRSIRLASMK